MQLAEFQRIQKTLENSGINYYAYAKGDSVVMAINDKDVDRLKNLGGDVNVGTSTEHKFKGIAAGSAVQSITTITTTTTGQ